MRKKNILPAPLLPAALTLAAALAVAVLVNGCAPPKVRVPQPPPAEQAEQVGQKATGGLISEGQRLLASGAVSRAGSTYERAIRIEPRNPQAWYGLAQVRFAQRRYQQTIELCRKTLTHLPTAHPLRRECTALMAAAEGKNQ
ncbi:MAG: tetratricopeptide repeat protein [Desulfobulbaceae bacterium]|nr:tetratricopeptide repeat protein [Desulfobulbaceae bacterium]